MNKKILIIIPISLVVIAYLLIMVKPYDTVSSYVGVDNFEDFSEINKIQNIPEVKTFLSKNENSALMKGFSSDPISVTIHASGGFTGQYLKIYLFFDQPFGITFGCWSDSGMERKYFSEIIEHIKNDSCRGM